MSVSRKLTVKSLTRVEGEGALRVKVVDGTSCGFPTPTRRYGETLPRAAE